MSDAQKATGAPQASEQVQEVSLLDQIVSEGRLAPRQRAGIGREVVVHNGPVRADAGSGRSLAELTADLDLDFA